MLVGAREVGYRRFLQVNGDQGHVQSRGVQEADQVDGHSWLDRGVTDDAGDAVEVGIVTGEMNQALIVHDGDDQRVAT